MFKENALHHCLVFVLNRDAFYRPADLQIFIYNSMLHNIMTNSTVRLSEMMSLKILENHPKLDATTAISVQPLNTIV